MRPSRSPRLAALVLALGLAAGGILTSPIIDSRPSSEGAKPEQPAGVDAGTELLPPLELVAAPAPDPCFDYGDLEAGRGAPARQEAFNRLDARGYARWHIACWHRWGEAEWRCLDRLWDAESSWYHLADGPNGPAGNTWGIPQAYPDRKMATHGADWRSNPRVQVRWGADYIRGRYGAPSGTGCTAGY